MVIRTATSVLRELSGRHQIVAVTGPRQSGKKTLIRHCFPDKPLISLEHPDLCEYASSSPGDFLAGYSDGGILDEIQRSPNLISHIMKAPEIPGGSGLFILTGPIPRNSLRDDSIGVLRLLPLSISEMTESGNLPEEIDNLLFRGSYPPLCEGTIPPSGWFPYYLSNFMDRDVRRLVNIRDQSNFQRFIKLCATQTGQLVNLSMMARECGITHNTAKSWLSILEANHLVYFLMPHHRSFNKRLVKTPKLYFLDTGLAAWLMGMNEPKELADHPMRGALFETWVVGELLKGRLNRGKPANFFFWRDNIGVEINIITELGGALYPIQISSVMDPTDIDVYHLGKWLKFAGDEARRGRLIYSGEERMWMNEAAVIPWRELDSLAERL
jgi:predicted AAA+ superfamily ATPase